MTPCDITIRMFQAKEDTPGAVEYPAISGPNGVVLPKRYIVFKSCLVICEQDRNIIQEMAGNDSIPDTYATRVSPELIEDIQKYHGGVLPDLICVATKEPEDLRFASSSDGVSKVFRQPCVGKLIPKKEWLDENGCYVCLIEAVEAA